MTARELLRFIVTLQRCDAHAGCLPVGTAAAAAAGRDGRSGRATGEGWREHRPDGGAAVLPARSFGRAEGGRRAAAVVAAAVVEEAVVVAVVGAVVA